MPCTPLKLAIVAIASTLVASPPAAASFNLSFVQGLLDDLGVEVDLPEIDVDLPPQAEEAVERAFDRAEMALSDVFGEGGLLNGVDLPSIPDLPNIPDLPGIDQPDVDQIVAEAQIRAQEAIDRALERARSVLGDLDLNLPDPVQDILDGVDGTDVPDVTQIIDDALDGVDLPNVDGILDDVLDAIGDTPVGDVIDQILGSDDPVSAVLENLPLDQLPDPAVEAITAALGNIPTLPFQVPSTSVGVPEPGAATLLGMTLLAGAVGRRQKVSRK